MDVTQFCDHLDLYGGDLSAWPDDARTEAEALLATSDEARSALRATNEFETLLRRSLELGGTSANILAARAMRQRQSRFIPASVRRAGWATAAVAALVLGIFIGDASPQHDENPDQVMAAAFDTIGVSDVD